MDMSEYGSVVKIALTLGLLLFGGWGSALIIIWLSRKLRVRADKEHTLKLVNQGNSSNQYHLSIKKAPPNLKFTFLFNNIPLALVFEEVEKETPDEEEPVETEVANTTGVVKQSKQKDKSKSAAVKPDGAIKAGKSVGEKSGLVANILGTLGNILPGSLGKNLKEQAGKARTVQAKTARATQAPQSAQRKMNSLKQSSGRLGVKKSEDKRDSKPALWTERTFEAKEERVVSRPTSDIVVKRKKIVEKNNSVQTKDINPGETLLLTLRIGTQEKRYPVGSFGYRLESQPMPLNERLGKVPPTVKNGLVHFEPIASWRYWLPFLSGVLVVLFALVGVFYGLIFIWT